MNRIKNILIAIFISSEFLVGLTVTAVTIWMPTQVSNLGDLILSDPEIWKYLPALTFIFSGAAINSSFKLRAPLESPANKILYQWPAYRLLVDRVYVGLFYSICSAGASIVLWIIGPKLSSIHVAAIFLTATFVSGMTALTMMLAQQKLRELLDLNT